MTVHVLRLACQRCGGSLRGLDGDAVFICPACITAYEVGAESLRAWSIEFRPVGGRVDLWLPFWSLTCRTHLSGDPARVARYRLDHIMQIFVKGFSLRNVSKVGNPGLFLTLKGAPPAHHANPLPAMVGCRRSSAVARQYARLFLLDILDRQQDITGIELAIEVIEIKLAAFPFSDRGQELECMVTRRRYPVALIDDVLSIRAAALQTRV